jgi:hypothetical protein
MSDEEAHNRADSAHHPETLISAQDCLCAPRCDIGGIHLVRHSSWPSSTAGPAPGGGLPAVLRRRHWRNAYGWYPTVSNDTWMTEHLTAATTVIPTIQHPRSGRRPLSSSQRSRTVPCELRRGHYIRRRLGRGSFGPRGRRHRAGRMTDYPGSAAPGIIRGNPRCSVWIRPEVGVGYRDNSRNRTFGPDVTGVMRRKWLASDLFG